VRPVYPSRRLGATDEDRRNGFERGGWALGAGDSETLTFINETYQRADAFLFGRRTYELFAGYWGVRDDLENPIVGALNTRPKYLASTTLTEPRWTDTTVLSGDLVAAIGELKAKPGVSSLIVVPVILGQGTRLFPEAGADIALDLVDSRVDSKGVMTQVYRPAGRPQYAT
jgi:dihydrofolate reductase